MGAHEEIGHQTVVSEPYRAASTAAFVVAQTRREGALRVSSNSPPVDASCLPLHPRDPLRSTLARQRRFWASRSVQYGLISLRWPARAHICTLLVYLAMKPRAVATLFLADLSTFPTTFKVGFGVFGGVEHDGGVSVFSKTSKGKLFSVEPRVCVNAL
jgi:hypothetical protein